MRNADRLLGIIYKEANMEKIFANLPHTYVNDGSYYLNISNRNFVREVVLNYINEYPDNYSPEEVENILKVYIEYGNKYIKDNGNACGLIMYCADRLFYCCNTNLTVNFDYLLEWEGFCNKIDSNIFIAAYAAINPNVDLKRTSAVTRHDNKYLNSILMNGAADNHMHFKASGYSADMSWANLILCSFNDDKALNAFIDNSRMLERNFAMSKSSALLILKKIKLIRLYLEYQISKDEKKLYSSNTFSNKIVFILSLDDELRFNCLLDKYKSILKPLMDYIEKQYEKCDNVKKYFMFEREFLKKLFLLMRDETNPLLMHLCNIYLMGISKIRFLFVQDNIGMGFKKFKLNENVKDQLLSLSSYSSHSIIRENDVYQSVFDRCYSSNIVKKAEFRIAPKSAEILLSTIKQIDDNNNLVSKQYKYLKKIKYGIIIHFIRSEVEPDLKKGMWRWESLRDKYKKDTRVVLNYINRHFKYSEKIVGIDAANYEMNCRPEILAPFFRRFRMEKNINRKLGITYHVGEAFDELCSGLRAIDEAIEFMNLRRGDRLGHALALGIDINKYRDVKRNRIAMPLQNYVDNLAWMYSLIAGSGAAEDKTCLSYLADEFYKYGSILFKNIYLHFNINDYVDSCILRGDSPETYIDSDKLKKYLKNYFYNDLENNYMFNNENINHKRAFLNKNARQLYRLYLTDIELFKNGKKYINLHLSNNYWDAVKVSQHLLRHKIYLKEIAIETNPSSNRKISYIKKFIDLPLLEFNHCHISNFIRNNGGEDLPVSINTDDCDIFQSDLSNEYALVAAALQRESYPIQEIYEYIEYLRKESLLQSFVED